MCRSPLGRRSALQVEMVELHAAQGEQGPGGGQRLPQLRRARRCCFTWHQMCTEAQSREAVQLFGFVREPVISPASTSPFIV